MGAPLVADIESTVEEDEVDLKEGTANDTDRRKRRESQRRTRPESSWEDRALAVERVPPANVPAFGPGGDLPMDARTKAMIDALDDIQIAQRRLEAKKKKEALALEDLTIVKVEEELQRRKLEERRRPSPLEE